jgi:hypothetical protein
MHLAYRKAHMLRKLDETPNNITQKSPLTTDVHALERKESKAVNITYPEKDCTNIKY